MGVWVFFCIMAIYVYVVFVYESIKFSMFVEDALYIQLEYVECIAFFFFLVWVRLFIGLLQHV